MTNTDDIQVQITLDDAIMQNMLGILSASLSNNDKSFSLDLKLWPEVKNELELQAVLPLVSAAKISPVLPDQEKTDLIIKTVSNVKFFHELMKAQSDVISLLSDNNIPAVILKGAAAAQYYEKSQLRTYGDIDLIVLPDDFEKAFDLLCSVGYQNHQKYDAPYSRHIGFTTPDGMKIELHQHFSSSSNMQENEKLDNWLYENIKNTEHVKVDRYDVPAFPTLENGLVLLTHINQHLSGGLGLRQIIDWMLYVRAELTDEFWKEEFRDRAEAIGMDYLAITVTRMCQKYLGLSTEVTWCNDADEKLADELMLYVLNNGNFGWKISYDKHSSTSVAREMVNPIKAFRYLTKGGIIHMSEAGLKPRKSIAWLYQIGHLCLKYIKSEHKKDIVKGITCSSAETDLLKRLRITRI